MMPPALLPVLSIFRPLEIDLLPRKPVPQLLHQRPNDPRVEGNQLADMHHPVPADTVVEVADKSPVRITSEEIRVGLQGVVESLANLWQRVLVVVAEGSNQVRQFIK